MKLRSERPRCSLALRQWWAGLLSQLSATSQCCPQCLTILRLRGFMGKYFQTSCGGWGGIYIDRLYTLPSMWTFQKPQQRQHSHLLYYNGEKAKMLSVKPENHVTDYINQKIPAEIKMTLFLIFSQ